MAVDFWREYFALSAGNMKARIVCVEQVEAFGPVTSDGHRADSANPSRSFGRVLGLSSALALPGNVSEVVTAGEIHNDDWHWTRGEPIFLNGCGLANQPPDSGFVQLIGTANGTNKIVVDMGTPVLL